MERKRITQLFPWLTPLRKKQRLLFFYGKMALDQNDYSHEIVKAPLPYPVFAAGSPLYNRNTGMDMVYQENKVFNLKLAAAVLNGLVIRPHETFSFWKLVRKADRTIPYKDGLLVKNGVLTTAYGGGMCQMSNLLFWLFLHTPITILERRGHAVRDFPDPSGDIPLGVDATLFEGWTDLKMRNDTDTAFQIRLRFENEQMIGSILSDKTMENVYTVSNDDLEYFQKNHKIVEEVDVVQHVVSAQTGKELSAKVLYRNRCEIGYALPDTVKVTVQAG